LGLFDKIKNAQHKADTSAKCPHCDAVLDPAPQRKKKCLSCGKDIYVRTDPLKREKILVNQSDALSIDAIRTIGFTEKEYRAVAEGLAHKFKEAPSIGDIVWGIINERLLDSLKSGNWQQAKMLYWEQARLLYGIGMDFFRLLQESTKCELHHYQSMDTNYKLEISAAAGSSCSKCHLLNGKILTITEALETMPIPVKDCEMRFCRCVYLPVVE